LLNQRAMRTIRIEDGLTEVCAGEIRTVNIVSGEGVVESAHHRERISTLPRKDRGHRPSIQHLAACPGQVEMGNLPGARKLEDVWNVAIGWTIVEIAVEGVCLQVALNVG